jgi:hypothetical protein
MREPQVLFGFNPVVELIAADAATFEVAMVSPKANVVFVRCRFARCRLDARLAV